MHKHPRSFWIPLVAAVERGADLRHVAERHGVNPSTLSWWRTVLRREARAQAPRMLPVVVDAPSAPGAPPARTAIEVVIAGGILRVPVGAE